MKVIEVIEKLTKLRNEIVNERKEKEPNFVISVNGNVFDYEEKISVREIWDREQLHVFLEIKL